MGKKKNLRTDVPNPRRKTWKVKKTERETEKRETEKRKTMTKR
jgi:hypothetical protein